ncbi:helix-turn-helix domain-containing protein [Algibacter miyuki]|uniref:Helix-turn-helix domain-containing protein n=1 Tax=Algibacter miyuki TaxID=1306933 RepID=A0ABV5GZA4_9FLAO|nr:helix-turn-helix domain-containing protein [Algibacter miyuki]MDN3666910.1 helix-turn-helix domain-containing protein [Algibacter miyuki]
MKKEFFMLSEDEIENLVERISNNLKKNYESQNRIQQDELLSIDEAAKLIKLAKATLYGLVHKKAIPFSKKGKRLYFQKTELLDWIKSDKKDTKQSMNYKVDEYLSKNRLT